MTTRRPEIVVGVTPGSDALVALRWACDLAQRNDARLTVVTACRPPRALLTASGWTYVEPRDVEAAGRFLQDEVLRREITGRTAGVRIRPVVARGNPVAALVRASAGADLLVVGRRPSRVRRLLTSSVSAGCANHAECPVVIVRAHGDAKGRRAPDAPFDALGRGVRLTEPVRPHGGPGSREARRAARFEVHHRS